MKLILSILIVFSFFSCAKKRQKEQKRVIVNNYTSVEPVFYYTKPHDKHWRLNNPNLEKSEGWLKAKCDKNIDNKDSIRVRITRQFLKHKSWGVYKGDLMGIDLITNKEIIFDFKCFTPDLTKGDWLNIK